MISASYVALRVLKLGERMQTGGMSIAEIFSRRPGADADEPESAARDGAVAASPRTGLDVVALSKCLGHRQVLDGVSLAVAPGEIVGLLGPDGAGKSVCFYAIAGLLKPDAGRVTLDGWDVTDLPTFRRAILGLSYLPQEPSIFRGLTVGENIEAVLEMFVENAQELHARRDTLLAEFGISHLRYASATSLSGGERRRCEIARALAGDPSIILLDEPFAGIDPMTITDIKLLIGQLRDRGVGVLITDQDLHDMLEVMTRVYVLFEGKVIFNGAPATMLHDPRVRCAYLGDGFDGA